ncbi:MAG: acyl-CoA dehydrogenase family protein, partial [Acidimicrobiales bacterium]
MDLRLTPEQEQLVGAFASLYAKEATPERVRAAETSPDTALWDRLRQIGVVDMAVGESAGGWGASLLDLALVAEQQGRSLAPAPVVETQTAVRLLEQLGAGRAAECVTGALAGDVL